MCPISYPLSMEEEKCKCKIDTFQLNQDLSDSLTLRFKRNFKVKHALTETISGLMTS